VNEWLAGAFGTAFIVAGIRFCAPLLLAATGETMAQRTGVLNVDLEAMMLVGAFAGAWLSFATGNAWVGVLASAVAGALLALVKGVACITFNANQIVTGAAMNIFALGLTTYASRYVFGFAQAPRVTGVPDWNIPYLSDVSILGPILFQRSPLTYLAFLLVPACSVLLFRTRWGLSLRAVGEHLAAANAVGIGVIKMRYAALLICGAMCGLGGACISLGQLHFFMENMIAGRGFVAMAAVVFGRWIPARVMLACLFFGFCQAGAYVLQVLDYPLPPQFALAMPYVLTVLVFALTAGKASGPAALTQPFVRE